MLSIINLELEQRVITIIMCVCVCVCVLCVCVCLYICLPHTHTHDDAVCMYVTVLPVVVKDMKNKKYEDFYEKKWFKVIRQLCLTILKC